MANSNLYPNIPAPETSQIYQLHFLSPAHFGEDSSGLERANEFIHSDTLTGAIYRSWATLFGKLALEQDLILPSQAYEVGKHTGVPLLLSSAFLYHGNQYYLPKPLIILIGEVRKELVDNLAFAKIFKEVQFLPALLWQACVQAKSLIQTGGSTQEVIKQFKQYKAAYSSSLVTRSFVSRSGGNTTPYVCRAVTYTPSAGLYFIVQFEPSKREYLQKRLETVLEWLGDNGLGGERSSGYGRFKYQRAEVNVSDILGPVPQQPNGYLLLNLAAANAADGLNNWRYQLVRRRNYTSAMNKTGEQSRASNVLLLGEGAATAAAAPPRGQLLNVTPREWSAPDFHQVYRSGLALCWPYREGRL